MKHILYKLFEYQQLTRQEATLILKNIADNQYNQAQIVAFITAFLMRSISVEELMGFRNALLEMRVPIDFSDFDIIDIVGTGGDEKNTFNISTAACFVVAAAGYKVVKHGNYSSTSISGASNVMELCGVKFTADADKLKRSLHESNMAYLHAPLFNPALKVVAPIRKALGVRTFFNILGPLVNPAVPQKQLLGVYNLTLARLYNYTFQTNEIQYAIVHTLDGYDEISLTHDFKILTDKEEKVYTTKALGFPQCTASDLYGGDCLTEAATIFNEVIAAKATAPKMNSVIANAAFAIQIFEPKKDIFSCIAIAKEALISGKVLQTFKKFILLNS